MWGDEDVQPIIDEAHEKMAEGDLNGAYELFQRACNHNPDAAEAHYGIGLVWFKREEYHRARQCLGRALTLDPGMHKAQDLMSQCDQQMRPTTPTASTSAAPEDDIFGGEDLATTSASTYKPAKRKGGGGAFTGLAWAGIIIFGIILVALGAWFAIDNFLGGGDIKPTDISGKPQILVPGGVDDKGKMTFKTAETVDESFHPSGNELMKTEVERDSTESADEDLIESVTSSLSISDEWNSSVVDKQDTDNGTMTISDNQETTTDLTLKDVLGALLFFPGIFLWAAGLISLLCIRIWLCILAFQKGFLHFIGVLCCEIYALIFMFAVYQGDSKRSLIKNFIIVVAMIIVGVALMLIGGLFVEKTI